MCFTETYFWLCRSAKILKSSFQPTLSIEIWWFGAEEAYALGGLA